MTREDVLDELNLVSTAADGGDLAFVNICVESGGAHEGL
jgi:hypothetical protein